MKLIDFLFGKLKQYLYNINVRVKKITSFTIKNNNDYEQERI